MKKCQEPKLSNLGIESAKGEVGDNAKIFFQCHYCKARFWSSEGRDEHEENCFYKPATPGFGPNGNVTPGVDYTLPVS